MEENNLQYTDLTVTKKKFYRELSYFTAAEVEYRRKGIFCIRQTFPEIEFLFAAPATFPSAVVFSVVVNFANYDNEPPSVRFSHPFTGHKVTRKEVPVNFIQLKMPELLNPNIPPQAQVTPLELLQGQPDDIPFLCIPGVKEYHDNPAHTGDSWYLYRSRGEGTLGYIIDTLYNHSIAQIRGLQIQYNIVGFEQSVNFQLT